MPTSRQVLMSSVQYETDLRAGQLAIADLAPIAARLGLAGVEYRDVYWRDKQTELPAARAQLAALGLRGTYASFSTLFNRDAAKRRQVIQDVEDAAALGSTLLRVFRGELADESPADQPMWDGARAVLDRARDLGVLVVLENYARTPGNRLADVLGALVALGGSGAGANVLGTNVDIANYVQNDQEPISAIRALAPWVRYVHLKDVRTSAEGKTATYLGAGSLPYGEILAELERTGQSFPLCFEFGGGGDPERALRQSIDYLARLA